MMTSTILTSDNVIATGAERPAARLAWLIVLIGVALLPFLPALDAQLLNWDDNELIQGNYRLRSGSVDAIVDLVRLRPRYGPLPLGLYIPLTQATLALEFSMCGDAPMLYHVTNLALHALNAVLVFFFMARVSRAHWTAFLCAVLFAIHPLRVESVVWVTERKDVLSSALFLCALLCYDAWRRRQRRGCYPASLACAVGAILAKPSAVTIPFILILYDALIWRRWSWRSLVGKLPFLLAALSGVLVTVHMQATHGALVPQEATNVLPNLFLALRGVLLYVEKTLAPVRLSPVYLRPAVIATNDPVTLLSVAVAAALLVLIVATWRRAPLVAFGLSWWLVALSPTLQVLPSGLQIMAADRFTYLPSVGLFLAVASVIVWAGRRRCARVLVSGGVVTLLLWWSWLTWQYAAVWHDDISLWTHTLRLFPTLSIARKNLAIGYQAAGRTNEAMALMRAILKTESDSLLLANLAIMSYVNGERTQALLYAQHAVAQNPNLYEGRYARSAALAAFGHTNDAIADLRAVIKLSPFFAKAHLHLADLLEHSGQPSAALEAYQHYARLAPRTFAAVMHLGRLYEESGALSEARDTYARAARLEPRNYQALHRYGYLCLRLRDFDTAYKAFAKVVTFAPGFATGWSDFAIAAREIGHTNEALHNSTHALELSPHSSKILYDHACILAGAGRPDEALVALSNALARAPQLKATARADTDFVPLRASPRFIALTSDDAP